MEIFDGLSAFDAAFLLAALYPDDGDEEGDLVDRLQEMSRQRENQAQDSASQRTLDAIAQIPPSEPNSRHNHEHDH